MNPILWPYAALAIVFWASYVKLASHTAGVSSLLRICVSPVSGSMMLLRGAACVAKTAGVMLSFGGCIDAAGSLSGGLAFSFAHSVVYAMASVVRFAETARGGKYSQCPLSMGAVPLLQKDRVLDAQVCTIRPD
ncbi:hypothetical protein J8I87_23990 [Paraburkholderia sp. LEh10]|jgi:hypothetical protein|uniref:hypothetical protein n=1 Tax=Paraburkholderia sp. LEh10 TaxID=2821353 RepID=UPI001AE905EF|nr:hypothetical protein [Paraburkholderia sp. LEh10]MBP0592738.1 hypothetical protein [Paraburkholderia sp. LEh10]